MNNDSLRRTSFFGAGRTITDAFLRDIKKGKKKEHEGDQQQRMRNLRWCPFDEGGRLAEEAEGPQDTVVFNGRNDLIGDREIR